MFKNVFKGLVCDGREHTVHSLKKQLCLHGLQIVIARHWWWLDGWVNWDTLLISVQ